MEPIDRILANFEVKGRALVIGSKVYATRTDRRDLYKSAVGLDLSEGQGVDIVHDLEQPLPEHYGKFDHIDCCSVLEHVQRPWLMCANIEAAMNPGATILISVPFVWRLHAYPSDYWRITRATLPILFPRIEWQMTDYLSGGESVRKPLAIKMDGVVYLKKTEVVGFGALRNTDNA